MLVVPPLPLSVQLKADSGATQHYFTPQDAHILHNKHQTLFGPTVQLPDGAQLQPTHVGHLPLPHSKLSNQATTAHVFPGLNNASLLLLGQLCDDNCIAILDKHKLQIIKDTNIILTGKRNTRDGLWDITLPAPPPTTSPYRTHQANAIIRKSQTQQELASYLHASLGSPPITTFIKAICAGNLLGWPGINTIQPHHIIKSLATSKGHLDQERRNLQSTKINKFSDSEPQLEEKQHSCYAIMTAAMPTGQGYTDITGRFPRQLSRGNQYLLLVYDYNSNGILVEPLKSRQAAEITRGWKLLHA